MKILTSLVLVSLIAGSASAGFNRDDSGTAAAQFLNLGAGARSSGMADAFTAVSDDATSIYWNPGGMAEISGFKASFMHAVWVEDIYYSFGSCVKNLGSAGSIGVGVQYLSYGRIKELDLAGVEVGSEINPSDVSASLAYAYKLAGFGLGLSAKYISSKIKESGSAVAFDLGAIKNFERFSYGLAVRNIGSGIRYVDTQEDLPLVVKFGACYKPIKNLRFAVDVNAPKSNEIYSAVGSEYSQIIGKGLAVAGRFGYSTKTKDIDGLQGLTAGAGIRINTYTIDYSFVPFGDLGNTHRVSIGLDF